MIQLLIFYLLLALSISVSWILVIPLLVLCRFLRGWQLLGVLAMALPVFKAQLISSEIELVKGKVEAVQHSTFSSRIRVEGDSRWFISELNESVERHCDVTLSAVTKTSPRPEVFGNFARRSRNNTHEATILEANCESIGEPESPLHSLVFGRLEALPVDVIERLEQLGLIHLFVVSGLHIGIVVSLLIVITTVFIRGRWVAVVAALGGVVFILYVQPGVSTSRVMVVLAIGVIVVWLRRRLSATAMVAFVFALLLVADVGYALQPGFWYSMLACFAIAVVGGAFRGGRMIGYGILQVVLTLQSSAIQVTSAPLVLSYALNFVLVLLWTLVVPVALFSVLFLPPVYLESVEKVFIWGIELLPASHSHLWSSINGWALALIIGYVWLAAISTFRDQVFVLLVLAVAFLVPSRFEGLTVVDVGQGSSTVVHSNGEALILDSGYGMSGYQVADSTLVHHLSEYPSERRWLLTSHDDADHSGGESYLESIGIRFLGRHCIVGQRFRVGSAVVQTLAPRPLRVFNSSNAASCIWLVRFPGWSALVMSDATINEEFDLVRSWGSDLDSDVLIIGHHGSTTSTSYALLNTVLPRFAVVSSGEKNQFGHPHPSVMNKLSQFQILSLVTANLGTLIFTQSAAGVTVTFSCQQLITYKQCNPEP